MLGKYINHCEDSLTAAVIPHLLHLPIELFWSLIVRASHGDDLPVQSGELMDIAYWPKWDPTGTSNTTHVEPDVFLRFKDFDLIIEAKRWDGKMQYLGQWQNELQSYHNEYGDDNQSVILLALGGIGNLNSETISTVHGLNKCRVIKCKWERLLNECKGLLREMSKLSYQHSMVKSQIRILEDVISLFAWHGFATGRWFAEFDFNKNRLHRAEKTQSTLRGIQGVYK